MKKDLGQKSVQRGSTTHYLAFTIRMFLLDEADCPQKQPTTKWLKWMNKLWTDCWNDMEV